MAVLVPEVWKFTKMVPRYLFVKNYILGPWVIGIVNFGPCDNFGEITVLTPGFSDNYNISPCVFFYKINKQTPNPIPYLIHKKQPTRPTIHPTPSQPTTSPNPPTNKSLKPVFILN